MRRLSKQTFNLRQTPSLVPLLHPLTSAICCLSISISPHKNRRNTVTAKAKLKYVCALYPMNKILLRQHYFCLRDMCLCRAKRHNSHLLHIFGLTLDHMTFWNQGDLVAVTLRFKDAILNFTALSLVVYWWLKNAANNIIHHHSNLQH